MKKKQAIPVQSRMIHPSLAAEQIKHLVQAAFKML